MKTALLILLIAFSVSACNGGKSKILEFPVTRQTYDYTCGPGAVQAVMAYYGEDFHESELIRILKTDENEGTNLKEIVDFLNSQGLKTSLKQHMTINELRSYIDRNIPVIVLIQAWGEENDFARNYKDCWDDGHFVVVIGYTVKDIILSDPALFTRGYIPISEFTDRWHDYDEGNTRTYQLGLAVYGKTPKFEQNTLERIR